MKLLLDADMLAFWATAKTEVTACLDHGDMWVRHTDAELCRDTYWEQCRNWAETFDCDLVDIVHCFTDRSAFRRDLYDGYKANRKGKVKPCGFAELKRELLSGSDVNAIMHQQIEADDLIGLFASKCRKEHEPYIVLSNDKDLKQIPGTHAWLDGEIYGVSTEEAERYSWTQALAGDSTDGIPGAKSIGPVTAERHLREIDISKPMECWAKVVEVYSEKGQLQDFAILQKRLTHILRDDEYDFHTSTVKLWNPPKH